MMIISTWFFGTPILLHMFSFILKVFWILCHDRRVRCKHLNSTYVFKPAFFTVKSHFCQVLILGYSVASF